MEKYLSADDQHDDADTRATIVNRKAELILARSETATTSELIDMTDDVAEFVSLELDVEQTRRRRLGFLGLFGSRKA